MHRDELGATEGGQGFATWKNEPSELTLVQTPEALAAVAEQVTKIYPAPHDLSQDALHEFLATISQNPFISAAIFVDRPESSTRPSLDIYLYVPKRLDLRADGAAFTSLGPAHAAFLSASEQRGSRQNSHLHIRAYQHSPTAEGILSLIKEGHRKLQLVS